MPTYEMTTVNLSWIWTVLGFATVCAVAALFAALHAWSSHRRMNRRLAQRVRALETCLRAVSAGSIGVGERLTGVSRELSQALERQAELEHRDPGQLPYRQAAKLVGLGASVDDLMESCGLSRAEAELLNLLQGASARRGHEVRTHH